MLNIQYVVVCDIEMNTGERQITIKIMRPSDMVRSAPFCDITQRRTQEEDKSHPYRGGSLKSRALIDITSGGQGGEVNRPI